MIIYQGSLNQFLKVAKMVSIGSFTLSNILIWGFLTSSRPLVKPFFVLATILPVITSVYVSRIYVTQIDYISNANQPTFLFEKQSLFGKIVQMKIPISEITSKNHIIFGKGVWRWKKNNSLLLIENSVMKQDPTITFYDNFIKKQS